MGNLGRRLAEDERLIKTRLFELVPAEPPGKRFSELVEAARKMGFSKPTLWRYLTRFERSGLIVHEGRFYRRNPLAGIALQSGKEWLSFEVLGTGVSIQARPIGSRKYFEEMRAARPRVTHAWRRTTSSWGKREIRRLLVMTVVDMLQAYLSLLGTVFSISDMAAAHEAANLMLALELEPPLIDYAETLWNLKDRFSLQDLDGIELSFKIRRVKEGEKSRSLQDGRTSLRL